MLSKHSREVGTARTVRACGAAGAIRSAWLVAALALAVAGICAAGASAHKLTLRGSPFVQDGLGQKPEAETLLATEVRRASAVLNGRVNPEGSNVTRCVFKYGETPSVTHEIQCANLPGSGETGIPVYAVLEGLTEGTTYYVELEATNKNGTGLGKLERFTTLPTEPRVATEPASAVEEEAAKLNGFVNPEGAEVTECYFEYGTNGKLDKTAPCSELPGSGEAAVPVSAEVTGLTKGSLYRFRLIAANEDGERGGGIEEFSTPPSTPKVSTGPAGKVGRKTALLHGVVNPNGLEVTQAHCYFLYGTNKALKESNKTIECSAAPGDGNEPVAVSAEVSGLEEHTVYYFKLIAENSAGQAAGVRGSFNTLPTKPKVQTRVADNIGAKQATLHAGVNPAGAVVTVCEFEYGTTPSYGKSIMCSEPIGGGEEPVAVKAVITGLQPNTTYYYRVHASNEYGFSYGYQLKFVTTEEGLSPEVSKVSPVKGPAAGGTEVKIKGANFTGATAVTFGETPGTIKEVTPTEIHAVAPAGTTGTVDVRVTTPFGTSEISSKDHYAYGAPSVTGVNPDSGPKAGGTEVTVTGHGFAVGAGKTTIDFGKTAATSVNCSSSSTCTAFTPMVGTDGEVEVRATVNGLGQKGKALAKFKYVG